MLILLLLLLNNVVVVILSNNIVDITCCVLEWCQFIVMVIYVVEVMDVVCTMMRSSSNENSNRKRNECWQHRTMSCRWQWRMRSDYLMWWNRMGIARELFLHPAQLPPPLDVDLRRPPRVRNRTHQAYSLSLSLSLSPCPLRHLRQHKPLDHSISTPPPPSRSPIVLLIILLIVLLIIKLIHGILFLILLILLIPFIVNHLWIDYRLLINNNNTVHIVDSDEEDGKNEEWL